MYLKRIEIYGFKSFAQKSVIDFDYKDIRNITAVVGPNGSGKSNVADAIRWVTGEQSNKNLRSKKNEDVIFCGSSAKPRGSYAEVTIVLSDDKLVKFELNGKEYELAEIEIARKLYRTGESVYLINQKKVRLTDIQQLLASLGFGQSSYTVIGQGMVDRLLFFTASERKVLFDEAAGVKQYEIKREQSLRKLESTDTNLIRLQDILTELVPRVANLRRLVKKAEGRKEYEAELVKAQSTYYGALLSEYTSLTETAESKRLDLSNKVVQIDQQISALSIDSASARVNPYLKEKHDLDNQISHETEKKESVRESVAFLRGQIASDRANADQAATKRAAIQAESERLKSSIPDMDSAAKSAETELLANSKKLTLEQTKSQKIEDSIAKLTMELASPADDKAADKLASLEGIKTSLEEEKNQLSGMVYSKRQEISFSKVREEQRLSLVDSLKRKLSENNISLESCLARIAAAEISKKKHSALVSEKKNRLTKVLDKLAATESELHKLAARVSDENLDELSAEVIVANKNHLGLSSKIESATTVADIAAIKSEFRDFGSNLTKIFGRFSEVAKAVSAKQRRAIEENITVIRSSSSLITKELQESQYQLMKVDTEIEAENGRKTDISIQIDAIQLEIDANKSVFSSEGIVAEIKLLEQGLTEVTQKLSLNLAEISKYSGAVNERQNAILREKDDLQKQQQEQRQIVHNLELTISRQESAFEGLTNSLQKAQTKLADTLEQMRLVEGTQLAGNSEAETTLKIKEKELSRIEEDIAKLRGGLTEVVAKSREFEQRGVSIEREKQVLQTEKASIQSQISVLDLSAAKASIRLEDVNEEIKALDLVIPKVTKHEILDQMEKDVLKLKIENIRRKLDTTASVDPETEAEYHELELRATEMTAQVEDLTKAKNDLTKVVSELDERIKHQFSDVFKNIATEFDRYFTMLFGGGNAKLSLGEDDEGSFGIEISANPPGKRVQSLAALSGGERTLTSLALLFAILSVNPSPFVVLDEVDAALDESNTARFIKILEDLAHKTQFIIISHNRETMKCASSLYGVTMDESHISKLLSVKLTEALVASKS
jgi:chromosome segregation protein